MSLMRPETVGSVASSSRVIAVEAPVRVELKTGLATATTVTVSEIAANLRVNSRSCVAPRLSVMLGLSSVVKPEMSALTL